MERFEIHAQTISEELRIVLCPQYQVTKIRDRNWTRLSSDSVQPRLQISSAGCVGKSQPSVCAARAFDETDIQLPHIQN